MKVYIAAPFFNAEQLNIVKEVEEILIKNKVSFFSPRSFGVIKEMNEEEKNKNMESIYNKNIYEIEISDILLCLIDHKDTGTTFEMGYYACLKTQYKNKKIITFSKEDNPINLMLRFCINFHITSYLQLDNYFGGKTTKFHLPQVNE